MATATTDRRDVFGGYSDEEKPLASYALLTGAFNLAVAGALLSAARSGRLPERLSGGDVLLFGIATHKLSRLIAKDTVTSFLRAPFVRYEGPGGINELDETPRGEGLRRAVGELLFCPQCVGQWVAGGFVSALPRAPRTTRLVAGLFASLTLADFLHLAYTSAREKASSSAPPGG